MFQKVGTVSEVTPGTAKVFDVGDREVCVVNIQGTFYAIDDLCSHADCNLSSGAIEGHKIECDCHGSMFDVRTGEPTTPPAVIAVDTFKIQVNGDDIEVEV